MSCYIIITKDFLDECIPGTILRTPDGRTISKDEDGLWGNTSWVLSSYADTEVIVLRGGCR